MTNYEKIKGMSIDDFNEIITGFGDCWACAFRKGSEECQSHPCSTGILLWLRREESEVRK